MSITAAAIQRRLSAIKGEDVYIHATGERGREIRMRGVLSGVYPRLFTVVKQTEEGSVTRCFSYTDIIMGRLKIHRIGAQNVR